MKVVGARAAAGFTIIEVMMFLAISGALVVALLATVGTAITRQRFSDSINTTQAFIQSQVNETLNVVNTRENGACSTTSGSTVLGAGTTQPGASNCVVLGRALDFSVGSSTITTYPVVGHEPATASSATGEALLAEYHPTIDTTNGHAYDIAWEEKVDIIYPSDVSRVLLLRSPDSGLIMTFGGTNAIQPTIEAGPRAVNICFDSGTLSGSKALVGFSGLSGAEGITTKFDIAPGDLTGKCL